MRFYSYADNRGIHYHPTKDEAKAAVECATREFVHNGITDPEVLNRITWGEVTERAVPTGEAGYALRRQDRLSYETEHPQVVDGRMENHEGHWLRLASYGQSELLEHDLVLTIVAIWLELSGKITRFKRYNFADINSLLDLLYEKYRVKRGGREGGVQLTTVDRKWKIIISTGKFIDFGPELAVAEEKLLEAAKQLATSVSGDADSVQAADLETIIVSKFKRKDGKVRVAEVLSLRQYKIHNEAWNEGMAIVCKAIMVTDKKQYLRLYKRDEQGGYTAIPLDIAAL